MEFWFVLLALLALPEPGVELAHNAEAAPGEDELLRALGDVFSNEELDYRSSRVDDPLRRDPSAEGGPTQLPGRIVTGGPPRHVRVTGIVCSRALVVEDDSAPENNFAFSARITGSPTGGLTLGARLDDCAPGAGVSGRLVSGFVRFDVTPAIDVVLGDYVVEAGQGHLFWSPGLFRGAFGSYPRTPRGVMPVLASPETRSLRGIGASGTVNAWGARFAGSLFVSERTLRGSRLGPDALGWLSPLVPGESLGEKSVPVRERLAGTALRFDAQGRLKGGCTGFVAYYSEPLSDRWLALPGRARVAGVAFDLGLFTKDISIAGEWAEFAEGEGSGLIAGSWAVRSDICLEVLLRRRARGISGRYASPPGYAPEGSREVGYGVSIEISRGWPVSWQLGMDHSTFDLSPGGQPGSRTRLTASGSFALAGTGRLLLLLRAVSVEELAERALPREIAHTLVDRRAQSWLRAVLEITPVPHLFLRTRLDATLVRRSLSGTGGSGESLVQELRWRPWRPMSLEATVILYGTSSYDSRLYWMESGTPGALAMAVLTGKGERWALTARYSSSILRCAIGLARTARAEGAVGSRWQEARSGFDVACQLDVLI